jgi:metal-responsive CopG/Arc/MetJ family transcriptional regulator
MSNTIKTAISIQKKLFEQADALAGQMKISRSHLFGLAIESFIRRYQNQALLDEINQAYSSQDDPDEQARLSKMRKGQRTLLEKEEW